MYAIEWNEKNPNYSSDEKVNSMFLKVQKDYINRLLAARGYVYMNQIFELLGGEWSPDDKNICIIYMKQYAYRQIEFEVFSDRIEILYPYI